MKAQQWVSELRASSMPVWQGELKKIIESASIARKIALVGMGHPLRSDDYAGSYIIKRIIANFRNKNSKRVALFDGEDNVENLITRIAELEPEHVVFIDACEMKEDAGETKLISVTQTAYPFFTTHGVPLKLLAQQVLPNSSVWILAIQPKSTDFGEQLSAEILPVADSISDVVVELLGERRQ